jgi:hypothetical protein
MVSCGFLRNSLAMPFLLCGECCGYEKCDGAMTLELQLIDARRCQGEKKLHR